MLVKAPWTHEQVRNLNEWQRGPVHPFTCGAKLHSEPHDVSKHPGAKLVAYPDGWECSVQGCDYRQDWAHDFMLNRPVFQPKLKLFQPKLKLWPETMVFEHRPVERKPPRYPETFPMTDADLAASRLLEARDAGFETVAQYEENSRRHLEARQ